MLAEPGAPGWFELHTRDYAATVQFYRDVFGWDTHVASDTDQFRYTTLGEGEGQLAGIMDVSDFPAEQFPAGWSIYFVVDDTDAAVAQAVELGGTIVQPAEDTPFGRLGTIADPPAPSSSWCRTRADALCVIKAPCPYLFTHRGAAPPTRMCRGP